MLLLGGGIISQIFYLQIFRGEQLKSDANKQIFDSRKVVAPRGNIYAANEQKTSLALSVPRYKVYVDLITINEIDFKSKVYELSDSLSLLLGKDLQMSGFKFLKQQRLDSNRYFHIAKGLRKDQIERLKKFPIFNLGKYREEVVLSLNQTRVQTLWYACE